MTRPDRIGLLLLFFIGALLHITTLAQPRQVIFDEVHFGKFVTAYCCTHQRIFDIHPPHTKLMIAGVAWLGGYRGGFDFDHIGEPYGDIPIFALRLLPALSGVALPLIIYAVLRQLGARWPLAFLGGWLTAFDNSLVIQTRIIALDGILLAATFGALSAYLAAVKSRTRRQWTWYVLAGVLGGLAVGTKFTGLAIVGLIGVLWLVRMWQLPQRWRPQLVAALVMVGSALLIYFGGWALHFAILTQSGPGDAFYTPNFSSGLPIKYMPLWGPCQ